MKKGAFLLSFLCALSAAAVSLAAEEQHPVLILRVRGTVDPAVAAYVSRGMEEARRSQASALVLELDTPGGLESSMRKINQLVLDSPVPVLAYVSPLGAGGAVIAESAQVAGTAPQAKGLENFLGQSEGRQVKTIFGTATLSLRGRPRRRFPETLLERLLHRLARPSLAYILLLLGIYGLIYELVSPGAFFPGAAGAVLLVLALAALQTLEVDWGGIALIVGALLFFVGETRMQLRGVLTAAGVAAFVLGSLFLFPGHRIAPLKLPWSTIIPSALLTAAFFLGIVGARVRALRQKGS